MFVYYCRELSYNQIEDLPSFYHCSALQEMWVFRPPRQSHTYCIKGSSFLSLPLHIVLWLHIILYHFPNRGLQHNQIRRIESSTFQQLASLRALWVNLYFVLVTSCTWYILKFVVFINSHNLRVRIVNWKIWRLVTNQRREKQKMMQQSIVPHYARDDGAQEHYLKGPRQSKISYFVWDMVTMNMIHIIFIIL